jgi:hypothetical protein
VRDAAVAAFVDEVRPLVAEGRFLPSAGKGLRADELAPLAAVDPRGPLVPADEGTLAAVTVASSVATVAPAAGGLRVAFEGLDVAGLDGAGLVASLADRGATVVAASIAAGAVVSPAGSSGGLDAAAVAAWARGEGAQPDGEGSTPAGVMGSDADVLVVGSRAGVLDHVVAEAVAARAVVPCGPVPVTAKGLAVLRRRGVVVLPDFVTTAGPVFGSWPPEGAGVGDVAAEASAAVRDVLGEVAGHADGPLLGAAKRAEAFLSTWVSEMPFGRPIA